MKTTKYIFDRIPSEYKENYRIDFTKKRLSIHRPIYIGIERDEKLQINIKDGIVELRNSKLWITLYSTGTFAHITVF